MSLVQRIIAKTRELLALEETKPKPPKPPPKPKPRPKPKPPATHLEGIDYSFGSGVTAEEIRAAGKSFVCRYLAEKGNPKDINKRELQNLLNAGLKVVLVWETYAEREKGGTAAGVNDAKDANAAVALLGLSGIPIYFAADWDTTEADQNEINAYLSGCAQVIGRSRVGAYGGLWTIKRSFDAKKIAYGWQTYAWSGTPTKWDTRAQIQQYHNGGRLGPAEVDLNRSTAADFGQWPRPK